MKSCVINSGILLSRLINSESYKNFDDLMKCKICFNILLKPHDCEKCGNTFCRDCINLLEQNGKPCPFNCENFTVKPSSLGIVSFLNNLKFYCINKDNGCNQSIDYCNVACHDKECNFSFATCPNVKCKKSVKRQLLEFHIRIECEYSLFKCENCEIDFNRNEYLEHIENCKLITNVFDFKNPIIDTHTNYSDLELDLKNISLAGFLKIILFQMAKNNLEVNNKFDVIQNEIKEIKEIKEDFNKVNSENLIFIENLHNDVDLINEKLHNIEIGGIETICNRKIEEINLKESVVHDLIPKNHSKDGSNVSSNSNDNSVNCNSNSYTTNSSGNIKIVNKLIENSTQQIKSYPDNNNINNTNNNPNTIHHNAINTKKNNIPVPLNKLDKKNDPNPGNVKKIAIRNNNKITNHSPVNRSPQNKRSPNPIHKTQIQETTESFNNRTNNITLIKTMLKNQDVIQDKLKNILNRIDKVEEFLGLESNKNTENIKLLIKEEFDQVKGQLNELTISSSISIK